MSESDYRPARFEVPATIDTNQLYDGEDAGGEGSDDEEALKISYASVMGRLKGGPENTQAYHTASFRPQHYASETPSRKYKQQYHEHEYLQQQQQQQEYAAFNHHQQQHNMDHLQQNASLNLSSEALTRMQQEIYQTKLEQGRAQLETTHLRQSGGMAQSHVPSYMRQDGGIRADMAYQQAKGVAALNISTGVIDAGHSDPLQNWLQVCLHIYVCTHTNCIHIPLIIYILIITYTYV